jgi:hypothetical protein
MRNKDGSIDLRKFGPFNVDRSPSGRLVSKGSIVHPIESYPDSKTKLRQEHIEEGVLTSRPRRSMSKGR